MMWGIPSAAIAIITGIIVAAYQPELKGIPQIATLGLGSIFLFALTVEIIKKRLLMNAISGRLYLMERDGFPFDTPGLKGEFKKYLDKRNSEQDVKNPENKDPVKNPDKNDPVYCLFKESYARQYLGHVVFAAAILTSILTYWEFIKFYNYESWSYLVGIAPVIAISIAFVIVRKDIIKNLKKRLKNREKVKENKV